MKLRHLAAILTTDAYESLAQHNPTLAQALLADIDEGATLDDVQAFLDTSPSLTRDEAALILRAAVHLIAQRDEPTSEAA